MKVLCISFPKEYDKRSTPIVEEGGTYNVFDMVEMVGFPQFGYYYELEEHRGYIYSVDLFVLCSEIDETERMSERTYQQLVHVL